MVYLLDGEFSLKHKKPLQPNYSAGLPPKNKNPYKSATHREVFREPLYPKQGVVTPRCEELLLPDVWRDYSTQRGGLTPFCRNSRCLKNATCPTEINFTGATFIEIPQSVAEPYTQLHSAQAFGVCLGEGGELTSKGIKLNSWLVCLASFSNFLAKSKNGLLWCKVNLP